MPVYRDLAATRTLTFAPTLHTYYRGAPLPIDGATVSMQVRRFPGADGAPLLTLAQIPFSERAAAIDADPDRRVLILSPLIGKANLDALPGKNQPEAGASQRFTYEIKLTYSDGVQDLLWAGSFVVSPGVDRS